MKGQAKSKGGFSLVEVVIAIAVLGALFAPICSGLVLSHRINAKSESVLQARLEVTSVVETLLAEGISVSKNAENKLVSKPYIFEGVTVSIDDENAVTDFWRSVTVTDDEGLVSITTTIRTREVAADG